MSISPEQRKALSKAISIFELGRTNLVGSQGLRITCIKDKGDTYEYKKKVVEREWSEVVVEQIRELDKENVHDVIHDNPDKFTDEYGEWKPPEKQLT